MSFAVSGGGRSVFGIGTAALDLLVGLLRHACMACQGQYQHEPSAVEANKTVKAGAFHQNVSQILCGGQAPNFRGILTL